MAIDRESLETHLRKAVANSSDRVASLRLIAELIRESGNFRWAGLYDVDHVHGTVTNIVWTGPAAPKYPTFPVTKGLTSSAISNRQTVNVGDVAADPRYLTALGTTKSEIIVPVLDPTGEIVLGTIDVESELPAAFGEEIQAILESCAKIIQPFWN